MLPEKFIFENLFPDCLRIVNIFLNKEKLLDYELKWLSFAPVQMFTASNRWLQYFAQCISA